MYWLNSPVSLNPYRDERKAAVPDTVRRYRCAMVDCRLLAAKSRQSGVCRRTARRYCRGTRPILPSGGAGRPSGRLSYVLLLASRPFRRSSATQAVQTARHKHSLFTGITIRHGTMRCSATNNGRSAVRSIGSKRGKYMASSSSRRA